MTHAPPLDKWQYCEPLTTCHMTPGGNGDGGGAGGGEGGNGDGGGTGGGTGGGDGGGGSNGGNGGVGGDGGGAGGSTSIWHMVPWKWEMIAAMSVPRYECDAVGAEAIASSDD